MQCCNVMFVVKHCACGSMNQHCSGVGDQLEYYSIIYARCFSLIPFSSWHLIAAHEKTGILTAHLTDWNLSTVNLILKIESNVIPDFALKPPGWSLERTLTSVFLVVCETTWKGLIIRLKCLFNLNSSPPSSQRGNPLTTGFLRVRHLPCALSYVTHVCNTRNICTYMKQLTHAHTHTQRVSPAAVGHLFLSLQPMSLRRLVENQSSSQVSHQHLPPAAHTISVYPALSHTHLFSISPNQWWKTHSDRSVR